MKYLDKDDIKALELINNEVDDKELKEKLLTMYIADIRKREHEYFRHDKRNIHYDQGDDVYLNKIESMLSETVEDSHTIAMRKIENEELNKAINQLNETEKLIIQLFFYLEKSTREISKIVGKHQTQVVRIKKNALKKLKIMKK